MESRVGQRETEQVHDLLARIESVDDENPAFLRSLRKIVNIRGRRIGRKDAGLPDAGRLGIETCQYQNGKEERGEPQTHRMRCYTSGPKVSNVVSIQTRDSIGQDVRRLQNSGKRVVFTNGCFDIIHPGHLDLLTRARQLGDALVVAINSDNSVRRLKGPERPVFPEDERAEILKALHMVDFVCTFDEDTPLETILVVHPDVLVKGADWTANIVGQREVEGWGGKVEALPLVAGQSTTGVIERVLQGLDSKKS